MWPLLQYVTQPVRQIYDTHHGNINWSIARFTYNISLLQIIFTDPRHKAIFTNVDYGKTFKRYMLDFTPSEVLYFEQDRNTFLVLDKEDPDRKVHSINTLIVNLLIDKFILAVLHHRFWRVFHHATKQREIVPLVVRWWNVRPFIRRTKGTIQ